MPSHHQQNTSAQDTPSSPPSPVPPAEKTATKFPYLLLSFTLVAITALIVALLAYLNTLQAVSSAVSSLAPEFHTETITDTFYLDRLNVRSTNGSILELATAERTETFNRKSSVAIWNNLVSLGTTESEISVPATYRYHVDLSEDWSLATQGHTCIVNAPMFKPTLPVAIDTSRMQKKTRSGWARFDKFENLTALESTITDQLADRAASPENLDRVRNACRDSIATFVTNWLLEKNQWGAGRFKEVLVVFPGDPTPPIHPTPDS